MQNEMYEQKHYLSLDNNYEYDDIVEIVSDVINDDLYSFFVGKKDNDIVIKTFTSSIPDFNTLACEECRDIVIEGIVNYLMMLSDCKCICFKQPSLELMASLYQPMIQKMAKRISYQWKYFEYEDLVQIGNLVMCELYNKGYYINKWILWTSFNNQVLMMCRKFKGEPQMVNISDKIKFDIKIDNEDLTYGDILEDKSYEEEKYENDEQQLEKYVFEEVKSIIIDKIGERQWNELWRDYGKNHTSNRTRASAHRLRAYFKELGLTRQDFINSYRR